MQLTLPAARALMVAAQGLHRRPAGPATKAGVLETIRRLGALQIDTIQVVARSPYFVLWSRLGDYDPRWLDELLAERALFEYWSHEASFLPIEDYALYRHRMIDPGSLGWRYSHGWLATHQDVVERVRREVRERGPLRAAGFDRCGQPSGWWAWTPEKRALEALFAAGELMIARRENFQRLYDLRERVHPSWDDSLLPPLEEAHRALALKAVRALGVTTARWLADYFRTPKVASATLLASLAEEGALLTAQVEGWQELAYVHPDNAALAATAPQAELTTFLSPFDSLVWDRARTRAVFGFDYALECYTPAAKRRYGYFTLPILRRGQLIGRLDPKAHRREGLFEVKALYLEPGIPLSDEPISDLSGALSECAAWHGTPQVVVRRSDPPALADLVRRAVDGR